MRAPLSGVVIAALALCAVSGCSASSPKPTGAFDPCKEITDSTIRNAGFDPNTKKTVQTVANYTVRCEISSAGGLGTLYLEHPNVLAPIQTYDAYLASARSVVGQPGGEAPTVTTINGRDAYVGPHTMLGCDVALRTAISVMIVQVRYSDETTCASAQQVATLLEPSIGNR
ncbi:DUF3558 family protein [Nocardia sp. NPDC088792]|uniref:DUF3558 family protein n=1 Tax=Nocardia sp. NPDC088792 TaxID=3364332 RepID=UPI003826F039